MEKVPVPVSAGAIATAIALAVSNIASPTELGSIAGTTAGEFRLCYQAAAGANEWTLYAWDNTSSASASSPFRVNGSSGQWIAVAGKYVNGEHRVGGILRVYDTAQIEFVTLDISGSRFRCNYPTSLTDTTASTSTTTGALIVSGGAGVAGRLTAGNIAVAAAGSLLCGDGSTAQNGPTVNSLTNADSIVFRVQVGSSDRWYLRKINVLESGSNAGSDLAFVARADDGTVIDNALTITRAAGGAITTTRPVSITSATASTSTTTGALIVSGGVGIAKELYVGRETVVSRATTGLFRALILDNSDTGSTRRCDLRISTNNSTSEALFVGVDQNGATYKAYIDNRSGGDLEIQHSGTAVVRFSTSAFTFLKNATSSNSLTMTNTTGTTLVISSTQAATSTTSGCATFAGGVGVAGAIYAGGNVNIEQSSVPTFRGYRTGTRLSGDTMGQVAVVLANNNITASMAVLAAENQSSTNGGAYWRFVAPPIGSIVNSTICDLNPATSRFYSTTASTSTTSGALVVDGGAGIAGSIYAGGSIYTGSSGAFLVNGATGRIGTASAGTGSFRCTVWNGSSDVEVWRAHQSGSMTIGSDAIATTATDGFLYVPTCAGAPTGTPTAQTGRAPIVVDSTNNKLYFFSGGAWRDAGP